MSCSKAFKDQAGSGGKIANRAAGQHLTCARQCADASADVHGHPAPLIAASLALSDVHARADPDAARGESWDQIQRAASRLGRPVEDGEDAVTCVLGTIQLLDRDRHPSRSALIRRQRARTPAAPR